MLFSRTFTLATSRAPALRAKKGTPPEDKKSSARRTTATARREFVAKRSASGPISERAAPMDWFTRSTAAAEVLKPPTSSMPLRELIALCKTIVTGYPILYGDGVISKILSDDMNGNVGRLEAAASDLEKAAPAGVRPTLADLLARRGAGGAPPSPHDPGVYGARWVSRTLRFVALLLQQLAADPELSIAEAGRATYAAVIAPYHMPVMAFVVSFILRWAPRRSWVLANPLGGASNDAACAACAALSGLVGPVAEAVAGALAERDLDFTDRLSAIPGGW